MESSFLLTFISLIVSISTMFLVVHLFREINFFPSLTAPLFLIFNNQAEEKENLGDSIYINIFPLYGSMITCLFAFLITGGRIGIPSGTFIEIFKAIQSKGELKIDPTTVIIIRDNFIFLISSFYLFIALTRISAVYISTSLANYTYLLFIFSIGLIFFISLRFPDEFEFVIDNIIKFFLKSILLSIFIILPICLGIIEFFIYYFRNSIAVNKVNYSLIRDRIEQHINMQQIFWTQEVENFTNKKIIEIIEKEGLIDLCWLTHTAPESHINSIFRGIIRFLKFKRNMEETNEILNKAKKIFIAKNRIILSNKIRKASIQNTLLHIEINNELFDERIQIISEPVRMRLLLINYKHAFIHLPIPFKEISNEQSNCVIYIDKPELVYPLVEYFETIWNGLSLSRSAELITDMVIANNINTIYVIHIINEKHYPIKIDEILNRLNIILESINSIVNRFELDKIIEHLIDIKLINRIDKDTVSASRYVNMCRMSKYAHDLYN